MQSLVRMCFRSNPELSRVDRATQGRQKGMWRVRHRELYLFLLRCCPPLGLGVNNLCTYLSAESNWCKRHTMDQSVLIAACHTALMTSFAFGSARHADHCASFSVCHFAAGDRIRAQPPPTSLHPNYTLFQRTESLKETASCY